MQNFKEYSKINLLLKRKKLFKIVKRLKIRLNGLFKYQQLWMIYQSWKNWS